MYTNAETVVTSLLGVIYNVSDDFVTVKLNNDDDLVVDFPIELFDTWMPVYGETIKYEIKERSDGYRYQNFELIAKENIKNPYKEEIRSLVESIR